MKIHIVQKGDTLWKIAKKYGVNFEELKKMNSQLSNPDMIMPGMKIKVPAAGIPVKKEAPIQPLPIKEAPKAVHPYAEMPPVTLPVTGVKEQPKEQPKVVSPVMMEAPKPPFVPPTPISQVYHPQQEIDVNNYYMVNMAMMNQTPQIPPKPVNVLPEIMKPVEESPESVESPEIEPPKMQPVYQQPCIPYMPPCPPPPPCCAPPVFPGSAFYYQGQPYGYPVGYPQQMSPNVMPAMSAMPTMPYMHGMESPDHLESSPESIDFNFPKSQYGVATDPYNPQMAPSFGYQPGMVSTPPYGYQPEATSPQAVPYEYPVAQPYQQYVPASPVQPASGYSPYGYQPYYGAPQMGFTPYGQTPTGGVETEPQMGMPTPYPSGSPVPPQFQQPYMQPTGQMWTAQQSYPPYEYPRQYYAMPDYDDESSDNEF